MLFTEVDPDILSYISFFYYIRHIIYKDNECAANSFSVSAKTQYPIMLKQMERTVFEIRLGIKWITKDAK